MSSDPLVLTKHENELVALKEELVQLKEAQVTSDLWQNFYESWVSLLALRRSLEADVAQQIFDAIDSDASVPFGLGLARLLMDTLIDSGKAPPELLKRLKAGPLKHVKAHA
eukprot:1416013-Prymnesium_polylepis.1